MARKSEDRFANIISAKTTMSAANTLTFIEIQTGISLGAGVGMLIDSIDYYWDPPSIELLDADGDYIAGMWTTSNAVTDVLEVDDKRIIHQASVMARISGTPASTQIVEAPFTKQFFPPMIVAAPKLYLGVDTSGVSSAITLRSKMYFRYIELSDKEYLELAETFLLVS